MEMVANSNLVYPIPMEIDDPYEELMVMQQLVEIENTEPDYQQYQKRFRHYLNYLKRCAKKSAGAVRTVIRAPRLKTVREAVEYQPYLKRRHDACGDKHEPPTKKMRK